MHLADGLLVMGLLRRFEPGAVLSYGVKGRGAQGAGSPGLRGPGGVAGGSGLS